MTGPRSRRRVSSIAAALCALATLARAQESPAPGVPAPAADAEAGPGPPPDPLESAGSVTGRVVAEALMGSGLATVGLLAGPELAAVACRTCLFAAGFAGANAMFPIGVYWGGGLVRGDGSFWLTAAAPWVVSASAFTALALDEDYDGKPAFHIGVIGGAIAAPLSIVLYEVTHAGRRAKAVRRGAGCRPKVAIGPQGDGLAVHVAGAF